MGMLTVQRYTFGPNLEILISIGGEWSRGQAHNKVHFDFEVKFDFRGQGLSTWKSTKVICTSDLNLVILPITA